MAGLDLTGQIGVVQTQLANDFRTELAAVSARIDADRSAAINEAVTAIRADLEVTRTSTLAEATRLIDANRLALEAQVSTELNTTRLDLTALATRIDTGFVGPIRPER